MCSASFQVFGLYLICHAAQARKFNLLKMYITKPSTSCRPSLQSVDWTLPDYPRLAFLRAVVLAGVVLVLVVALDVRQVVGADAA